MPNSELDLLDDQMAGVVLHLAHETESPWPLHIYDYEGTHRRILLEPGDMFMFEGCRFEQLLNSTPLMFTLVVSLVYYYNFGTSDSPAKLPA